MSDKEESGTTNSEYHKLVGRCEICEHKTQDYMLLYLCKANIDRYGERQHINLDGCCEGFEFDVYEFNKIKKQREFIEKYKKKTEDIW